MTNENQNNNTGGNEPDFIALCQTAGNKYARIGVGWYHKDGEGISVDLDVMPISGEVILRFALSMREKATINLSIMDMEENQPHRVALYPKNVEGRDKPIWFKIGEAWKHADAKGMTVHLQQIPRDYRFALFVPLQEKQPSGTPKQDAQPLQGVI